MRGRAIGSGAGRGQCDPPDVEPNPQQVDWVDEMMIAAIQIP